MSNEERPTADKPMELSVSHLMLSHFGQELHDQSKSFNRAFSDLHKLGCQASSTVEDCLPFRELFLQDYSSLEKMLVLINVVLFATSLSADKVDQEVSAAILYIMFAIGYFVTTTTCLTGAASFKRGTSPHTTSDHAAAGTASEEKPRKPTTELNLIIPETLVQQKATGAKTASKKQVAAKRGTDPRKSVSSAQPEKKPALTVSATHNSLKTRQKRNPC